MPLSLLDKKCVSVKRGMKVVYTEDDVQEPLRSDLQDPGWKDTKALTRVFKAPGKRAGTTRVVTIMFPYCLFDYGAARIPLRERMIVVNWWLQLTADFQRSKMRFLKTQFLFTRQSGQLSNQYDAAHPKATGIFDTDALRRRHVLESASHQCLSRGRSRRSVNDHAKTNSINWHPRFVTDQVVDLRLWMVELSERPSTRTGKCI